MAFQYAHFFRNAWYVAFNNPKNAHESAVVQPALYASGRFDYQVLTQPALDLPKQPTKCLAATQGAYCFFPSASVFA